MCHHIKYVFAQCKNPNPTIHSASDKDMPICIRPCPKAYNEKGELNHNHFRRCEKYTLETVKIRSRCVDRGYGCTYCAKTPAPSAYDPEFEFLIEQPNGATLHMFGSQLPRLEEMTWYVPAVPVRFNWTGSRKRKADDDTAPAEQAATIKDEAYLHGAEPLSPKSIPVTTGTVSKPSPSAATEEPSKLTRHLSRRVSKILAPESSTATPIDPSASAEHESVPVPSMASRPLGNKRPERPLPNWAKEARRARERPA